MLFVILAAVCGFVGLVAGLFSGGAVNFRNFGSSGKTMIGFPVALIIAIGFFAAGGNLALAASFAICFMFGLFMRNV